MQHAHHRAALGHQVPDPLKPVDLMRRIQMGQWLVHEHHGRGHRQQAGQQHTLALAARQFADGSVAPGPGLHRLQGLLHLQAVLRAGRRQPALMGQTSEHHHIADTQLVRHRLALPQPSQLPRSFAPTQRRQWLAQPVHLSLHRQQTRQGLEQGGLARAIGSEHTGPAPRCQTQIDAWQNQPITQAHLQRLRLQGRRHERPPPRLPCDMRTSR